MVVRVPPALVGRVDTGQKVLVVPRKERGQGVFEVLTLDGVSLGRFVRRDGQLPDWWRRPHLVDAEVISVGHDEERPRVVIQLVGV